jgi:hypothetical protein
MMRNSDDNISKLQILYSLRDSIPSSINGIPLESLQRNINTFIINYENYIYGIDSDSDLICRGYRDIYGNLQNTTVKEREQCLLNEILQRYGISIDESLFYPDQLRRILAALDTVGSRLTEILAKCLGDSDSSLSIVEDFLPVDETSRLTIQQRVFRAVFPDFKTISYDTSLDYALTTGNSLVTLSSSTFNPFDYTETKAEIERIIIHEIGHVFQNSFGTVPIDQIESVTILRAEGAIELLITPPELYTPRTASLRDGEPLESATGLVTAEFTPTGGGPIPWLSIEYLAVTAGAWNGKTPFTAGPYAPTTNRRLFLNEGRLFAPAYPKEGFSDAFSAFMQLGSSVPENEFPTDDSRRIFFEENMCDWIMTLIST